MRYLTIPGDRVLAVENWDGTTPRYLSIALLRDFAFALQTVPFALDRVAHEGTIGVLSGKVEVEQASRKSGIHKGPETSWIGRWIVGDMRIAGLQSFRNSWMVLRRSSRDRTPCHFLEGIALEGHSSVVHNTG
jgi:hypothetical protein